MPIYRMRAEHSTVVPATLAQVWRFVDDREAQVEYDPRLMRIDVIEGAWATPGCRAVATAVTPTGEVVRFEQRTETVDRPHSFSTSTAFPDGMTRAFHRFAEVDGGVTWTHRIEVQTRALSWPEFLVVKTTERKRRAQVRDDYERDRQALVAAVAAYSQSERA
ncbi:SRPBCC family protein [Demequina sp.]|uniref:SRPBCC family protein n=1 Tax=Demequina sp. TaxID=2050685 RepID=UPI003A8A2999